MKILNESNVSRLISLINAAFAPLVSPSITGIPTAPTASSDTNNTQIATTAFVQGLLPEEYTSAEVETIWNNYFNPT